MKKIVVTGGAGFIGSAVLHHLMAQKDIEVFNIDVLTYAGNLDSLKDFSDNPRYHFYQTDIVDGDAISKIFEEIKPDGVMHLAAESHVDRSIDGPGDFIRTNVQGTYCILEAARKHWLSLEGEAKEKFRLLHISTDEVYGSLGDSGFFVESTPYQPSSPYSASKASSDHLVRAWFHTYGMPTMITNCSNNYGPRHFPEKLIPLMILKALKGEKLPVYGKGDNVRDWLYVEDHARALCKVLAEGKPGETYNIGGHNEMSNLDVVKTLCQIVDELRPEASMPDRSQLIEFVKDRPGHDFRYAIDASKIEKELGWKPEETFETGLRKTVQWYLDNSDWWEKILSGKYRGERLGEGV